MLFYKEGEDAYKASSLKNFRIWKRLRKKDISDKLNMDLNMYIKVEEGRKKIDLETANKITNILETNIERIFRKLV
jgi:DNA-binding XRE family transcriptional regulator